MKCGGGNQKVKKFNLILRREGKEWRRGSIQEIVADAFHSWESKKKKKSSNIGWRMYINSIDKNKLTPWHIIIEQQNINDKIREDKGKSPIGQESQQQ